MSSFDFFVNLPSVAREKIFRKCQFSAQRRIFRVYRGTPEATTFEPIKKYHQPFSCWLCQCSVWIEMFWKCQVGYNTDGLGGFEYSAVRCEPAHDTAGFKLLYKYQEKNHLTDREVYTLRDFKTDDYKEADQILADFFREIENVFKAKSDPPCSRWREGPIEDSTDSTSSSPGTHPLRSIKVLSSRKSQKSSQKSTQKSSFSQKSTQTQ